MRRDTLRTYLQRLLLASLSTAALHGCSSNCPSQPQSSTWTLYPQDVIIPPGGLGSATDGGWLPLSTCQSNPLCTSQGWTEIHKCRIYTYYQSNQLYCEGQTDDCPYLIVDPPSPPNSTGRRTAGLREPSFRTTALRGYLAQAAYLEAASIDAFLRLAGELALHGAPRRLIARALRAADDERRHARVMTRLARLDAVPIVEIEAVPPRTLEEVARENAVEGCVNETFGAALATFQAQAAGDQRLRTAMKRIALDETGHAELAFAVARWAEPRLDRAARARVRESRREAAARLGRVVDVKAPPWAARAGLMPRPMAREVVARMTRDLWS
jgi:hypothetical protein